NATTSGRRGLGKRGSATRACKRSSRVVRFSSTGTLYLRRPRFDGSGVPRKCQAKILRPLFAIPERQSQGSGDDLLEVGRCVPFGDAQIGHHREIVLTRGKS